MEEQNNNIISSPSIQEKHEEALKKYELLNNDYGTRATKYKKRYKLLTNLSVILGATVTIISAIPLISDIKWPITMVAVLSTLCTTLLTTTRSQALWVLSRDAQQKLQSEYFSYKQNIADYKELTDEERVDYFSEQLIQIHMAGHENWKQSLPQQDKQKKR